MPMLPTSYDNPDRDGRLVPRASTLGSRQRALQTRYRSDPEASVRRTKVKPYLLRGTAVRLIPYYTDVDEELVEPARTWLRRHGEIPQVVSSEARRSAYFDGNRLKGGLTRDVADMIQLGRQLVEKEVVKTDPQIWEQMLEEYKQQKVGQLPPSGFPERLILEGYLVSQVRQMRKLAQALRDQLKKGELMSRFDRHFDFLNTVAPRVKLDLE